MQTLKWMKMALDHIKLTRELLKEYNVSESEASLLVSAVSRCKRNEMLGIFHRRYR